VIVYTGCSLKPMGCWRGRFGATGPVCWEFLKKTNIFGTHNFCLHAIIYGVGTLCHCGLSVMVGNICYYGKTLLVERICSFQNPANGVTAMHNLRPHGKCGFGGT